MTGNTTRAWAAMFAAWLIIIMLFSTACLAQESPDTKSGEATFPLAEEQPQVPDTPLPGEPFAPISNLEIVPLDSSMVLAAKEFVEQLKNSTVLDIKAMVYAPPGLQPYLVMSGPPDLLQQAALLRQKLLPNNTAMPLVIISASLRELTDSISRSLGLDIIPQVSVVAGAEWKSPAMDGQKSRTVSATVSTIKKDVVNFSDGANNSKVLVSSEVYTPNGIKAQISNVKSVPIFSTDNQGNVITQFQNLETSITVTPTVLDYRQEQPEKSFIRVDVDVKVSVISGKQEYQGVSAPEYSVKTMTTTRVLEANNQSYVIGTFVSDNDTKEVSGLPILGKLPILKYLFSQEITQKQRNTAILTLSVRLLPPADK